MIDQIRNILNYLDIRNVWNALRNGKKHCFFATHIVHCLESANIRTNFQSMLSRSNYENDNHWLGARSKWRPHKPSKNARCNRILPSLSGAIATMPETETFKMNNNCSRWNIVKTHTAVFINCWPNCKTVCTFALLHKYNFNNYKTTGMSKISADTVCNL